MQPALLDLTAHTVRLAGETDFAGWRDAARRLALSGVRPEEVAWIVEPDQAKSAPPLDPPAGTFSP